MVKNENLPTESAGASLPVFVDLEKTRRRRLGDCPQGADPGRFQKLLHFDSSHLFRITASSARVTGLSGRKLPSG